MTPELLADIDDYIEQLFVEDDSTLTANVADAEAAGLPKIQISPNQGRLLYLLTKISGARRVLEIGTLGGYSTTWLARALPPGGTVTTLELNQKHADVAATKSRARRRRRARLHSRRVRCRDIATIHRATRRAVRLHLHRCGQAWLQRDTSTRCCSCPGQAP